MIRAIFGASPMPNQMMNSGIRPTHGHGPQHLHGRVDEVLAEPEQPRDQGESGADDDAEQQSDRDPLQRHHIAEVSDPSAIRSRPCPWRW